MKSESSLGKNFMSKIVTFSIVFFASLFSLFLIIESQYDSRDFEFVDFITVVVVSIVLIYSFTRLIKVIIDAVNYGSIVANYVCYKKIKSKLFRASFNNANLTLRILKEINGYTDALLDNVQREAPEGFVKLTDEEARKLLKEHYESINNLHNGEIYISKEDYERLKDEASSKSEEALDEELEESFIKEVKETSNEELKK